MHFSTLRVVSMARALLASGLAFVAVGCNAMSGHVMNQTGMVHYQHGNVVAARHDFQRAVIDNPSNPNYVHNLASALRKVGDHAGAERAWRHALAVDPSHQPSYHGLAVMMRDQGRHAEAYDLLEGWVQTQPYLVAPHVEMAWLQRESGNLAAAEQSLRNALQRQPDHPVALAHLGQVYQDAGQPQRAASLYRRSLAANWNQPQVQSRLAQVAPTSQPAAAQRTWASVTPAYRPQPAYAGPQPQGAWTYYRPSPPVYVNADPAHAPQMTYELPVVRPY